MDYKTKSIITIAVIIVFMVIIGVFINDLDNKITGAVIKPVCECTDDLDCDDNNPCTEDICLYPEDCKASICIHKEIKDCKE